MARAIPLAVVAALFAFPGGTSAAPHARDTTLYLHCEANAQDPTAGADFYLDEWDSDDAVSPCGGDANAGPASEISISWPARSGVPFVLDARRDIVVEIALRGVYAESSLSVEVLGKVGGSQRSMGAVTQDISQAPGIAIPTDTVELTIPLGRSLHRKRVTRFELVTKIEGTVQATSFEVDSPASHVTIPTLHSGGRHVH